MRRLSGLTALFALVALAYPSSQSIPQLGGAAGAWQQILKVKTTASVMHVTAHPDDEHGGVLAKLSRGDGARLALFTLTRGESGDNAIGPQLFDALALIRTDELLNAGRYYGVDEQYFSTFADYGFSKRLDEAFDKWGRQEVLREAVRVMRTSRPWIVISRFQGNQRDGHGNHQAAGIIGPEAARLAGDPTVFPEQIAEGLRPWKPFKIYIGGVRQGEEMSLAVDSGEYSPFLGDSFDNVARFGLSYQRSQNSGRFSPGAGPNLGYYRRTDVETAVSGQEASAFDGLDTTFAGLFKTLGRTAPANVAAMMGSIDAAVARAMRTFTLTEPALAVPALAEGLRTTREVIAAVPTEPEVLFVLRIKERQFQDAINAALGLDLMATAQPAGTPAGGGRGGGGGFGAAPAMTAPVPGQTFEVALRFANRGGLPLDLAASAFTLETASGWTATPIAAPAPPASLARHAVVNARFNVAVADEAPLSTKPYFSRPNGIADSRYTLSDPAQFGRPFSPAPLVAVARYSVQGVPVTMRQTVYRRETKAPYGDALREVRTVPRLSVSLSPSSAIIPLTAATKQVDIEVALLHNGPDATTGQLVLKMPAGWVSTPASQPFSFARPGERMSYTFTVKPPTIDDKSYQVEAVATANGKTYTEGYELIDQRDLEVRYLYRPSTAMVRGVNVTIVPGLKVGYVMGIGDTVPLGLQQLGADVTLLGERELASANLSTFDTIMVGTRAYAVRDDLKTYNKRLLDYVQAGGNMVVLYNTAEFVPGEYAPYPGELLFSAEEVSEEDSPVEILAPAQQSFTWPNVITKADFDGWVEQRGSKFFSKWDPRYTAMISTYDKGQAPQQGGWLTTRYGQGTWTYFAYALHRQFPYGVAGPYRIAANLLALGKTPTR